MANRGNGAAADAVTFTERLAKEFWAQLFDGNVAHATWADLTPEYRSKVVRCMASAIDVTPSK